MTKNKKQMNKKTILKTKSQLRFEEIDSKEENKKEEKS